MFGKRRDAITTRLAHIDALVDRMDRRMERIETVTLVREPAAAVAADAYEGLRKQIVTAVSARTSHLSQLAQWDVALRRGAGPDDLADLLDRWFEQAGLEKVTDPHHPDFARCFEFVDDADSGPVEVLEAAYVDQFTGRAVRLGRARHVARRPQHEGGKR
ncbi:hypothetical protein [Asanoa siamensis]|uniref:GrpE protein n=1 Tax=Asanoa siamensis TaxID=926357 RepID=A0ABQ4CR88_9ACTN|nr:hypothetical protein [Asanoa siamensis]GIF73794.1 hypothetical protein Asi02nite_33120 [Asanoa siamensis]